MSNVLRLTDRLAIHRTPEQVQADIEARAAERRAVAARAQRARQRSMGLLRLAPWASWRAIEDKYMEASRLTRLTGVVHEVDHIVPLQGTTVCGLHCESNLRVITKKANREKSNRFTEDVVGDSGIEPLTSTV